MYRDLEQGFDVEADQLLGDLVARARHARRSDAADRSGVHQPQSVSSEARPVKRSTERILATHAGALPRPDDLKELVFAKARGERYDAERLAGRLRECVARGRAPAGRVRDRFGQRRRDRQDELHQLLPRAHRRGFETRSFGPGEGPPPLDISARDEKVFREYFASGRGNTIGHAGRMQVFCVEPLRYIGQAALNEDIANLKAALRGRRRGRRVHEREYARARSSTGCATSTTRRRRIPLRIADVMREEYLAIVDAGFILQIDDPDLPDAWQMFPDMIVEEYRTLRDVARRGAQPRAARHSARTRSSCTSAGAASTVRTRTTSRSPNHRHHLQRQRRALLDRSLQPDARARMARLRGRQAARRCDLIPGVVGHCTDFIEHPELVAERLERYAELVGRENVIAGTDCGIGPRVGHPKIAWAKLRSIADGARSRAAACGAPPPDARRRRRGIRCDPRTVWREHTEPVPGPTEVAVRLGLTSVNFATSRRAADFGAQVPFTPGLDGVGVVCVAGAGVTRLRSGDRSPSGPNGSYAESSRHKIVGIGRRAISDEAAASLTALVMAGTCSPGPPPAARRNRADPRGRGRRGVGARADGAQPAPVRSLRRREARKS